MSQVYFDDSILDRMLLPSESCMHVTFTRPEYLTNAATVTVSQDQYQSLVGHIQKSFKRNKSQPDQPLVQIIGRSYSTNDAFFEACGRYHLLNTCNSWVGRGLKAAGVRVPWLSPMPKSPTMYFAAE